ncbi:MAG: excalibur calcium-binding domain-containing protein [Methylococcaceae bacterium]
MEYKGVLQRWNDDKGFGFIISDNKQHSDVFIHISVLKNTSRRPVNGDVIFYQLYTDYNGKTKAINARIEGVALIEKNKKYHHKKTNRNENNIFVNFMSIGIFILAILIWMSYEKYQSQRAEIDVNDNVSIEYENVPQTTKLSYHCDGRTYCSEMSSCEEARFFITHCPNTKMDGDNDRVPCEKQWC